MASITLRSAVGRPLTNSEVDANFSALNLELGQKLVASLNLLDLPNPAQARSNLGLGNVENKSSATIRSELTSGNVTGALGYTPLSTGGGTLTGNLIFAQSASPHTSYIQFGDNTGWFLRFMTNVSGTPTQRFSFSDQGNFSANGTIAANGSITTSSAMYVTGQTVLHAGNYSSYAPSLGGGNAYGTWGISISGSAAQLGGVDASNYFRTDGSYPNASMDTAVEGYWHVAPGSPGLPENSYGHRWDYDHLNNGQWVVQMYSPTGGDPNLWFRQCRNFGWQPWRKILDSSNYSAYALPLSGGSVSGAIYATNGAYTELNYFDAPGAKGTYVWVRAQMGQFNGGGDSVRFSVMRSIHDNGAQPYGGPSAEFTVHSREWHNGQECAMVYYSEHGSGSGTGGQYISHAGPRDLAGGGYWFYMRLEGGIRYIIRKHASSGYMSGFSETTDPGSVPQINGWGLSLLGNAGGFWANKVVVTDKLRIRRSEICWYQHAGNSGGAYLHIKTSLWMGSGVPGNSQPTMSLFHVKGYTYDSETIDSMVGFHNWSGNAYNLRMTNAGSRVAAVSPYQSSDGYVVLVFNVGTNYTGITIDYHQAYPYQYQDVFVQAVTGSASASGAY